MILFCSFDGEIISIEVSSLGYKPRIEISGKCRDVSKYQAHSCPKAIRALGLSLKDVFPSRVFFGLFLFKNIENLTL